MYCDSSILATHDTWTYSMCSFGQEKKKKKKEIWHSVEFLAAHHLNAWFRKQPDT